MSIESNTTRPQPARYRPRPQSVVTSGSMLLQQVHTPEGFPFQQAPFHLGARTSSTTNVLGRLAAPRGSPYQRPSPRQDFQSSTPGTHTWKSPQLRSKFSSANGSAVEDVHKYDQFQTTTGPRQHRHSYAPPGSKSSAALIPPTDLSLLTKENPDTKRYSLQQNIARSQDTLDLPPASFGSEDNREKNKSGRRNDRDCLPSQHQQWSTRRIAGDGGDGVFVLSRHGPGARAVRRGKRRSWNNSAGESSTQLPSFGHRVGDAHRSSGAEERGSSNLATATSPSTRLGHQRNKTTATVSHVHRRPDSETLLQQTSVHDSPTQPTCLAVLSLLPSSSPQDSPFAFGYGPGPVVYEVIPEQCTVGAFSASPTILKPSLTAPGRRRGGSERSTWTTTFGRELDPATLSALAALDGTSIESYEDGPGSPPWPYQHMPVKRNDDRWQNQKHVRFASREQYAPSVCCASSTGSAASSAASRMGQAGASQDDVEAEEEDGPEDAALQRAWENAQQNRAGGTGVGRRLSRYSHRRQRGEGPNVADEEWDNAERFRFPGQTGDTSPQQQKQQQQQQGAGAVERESGHRRHARSSVRSVRDLFSARRRDEHGDDTFERGGVEGTSDAMQHGHARRKSLIVRLSGAWKTVLEKKPALKRGTSIN